MRPKDTLKTDYPGTVASGHSGEGKTCVKPVVDKPKERKPRKVRTDEQKDVRFENTVAGLDRFLSRRFARGVKPEDIRYFDSRPLGRKAA